MKTWTPDASQHFEAWLGRVRTSVARDPSLNAEDIAQDLRAHVHAELEAVAEPVTVGALETVLASLGTPPQWGDTVKEARPTVKFYEGAGDKVTEWQELLAGEWGMPVLLFVLTLIAMPTFDTIGVPLLAVAYLVARSKAVYAPRDLVGVKKWIVYLPLAVGSGVLAGLVLGFPIIVGNTNDRFQTLWILGLWWVIVGLLTAREPRHVQTALQPFANGFDASHGRMLSLIGAGFVVAGTVMLMSY
jgi:hypothetical protein